MEPTKKLNLKENSQEYLEKKQDRLNVSENPEVKETVLSVSEGVNSLNENADVFTNGEVAEKNKAIGENNGSSAAIQATTATATAIAQLPSVEMMIKQTVEAIENELKTKEKEMKIMSKRKGTKPIDLNKAAIEIRFLNGLLSKLKSAAKQASDFVISLWKQYVGKIG